MNVGVRRVSQEFPEGDLPVEDPRGARRSRRRAPEVLRDENGLVLVEASFIYPVVFAVLALLLYAGDMFYQRSWIEAAVLRYSIEGAAEVGNSAIENISVDKRLAPGFSTSALSRMIRTVSSPTEARTPTLERVRARTRRRSARRLRLFALLHSRD